MGLDKKFIQEHTIRAPKVPTIVENELLVFFDVDDTLVMWEPLSPDHIEVKNPYNTDSDWVKPHQGHIKILKDRHARGSTIIVWSAGGYKWAHAVVEALGLSQYVSFIMSKPFMYVDDKEASQILGERLYLGKDSDYGKKTINKESS